jgi:hypothetical protein
MKPENLEKAAEINKRINDINEAISQIDYSNTLVFSKMNDYFGLKNGTSFKLHTLEREHKDKFDIICENAKFLTIALLREIRGNLTKEVEKL